MPIAAWLNPHSTTGYAVEISKFFNIQPLGMQFMLSRMVASGLTMEEARAVLGGLPILLKQCLREKEKTRECQASVRAAERLHEPGRQRDAPPPRSS